MRLKLRALSEKPFSETCALHHNNPRLLIFKAVGVVWFSLVDDFGGKNSSVFPEFPLRYNPSTTTLKVSPFLISVAKSMSQQDIGKIEGEHKDSLSWLSEE
jgi:hypothetical protein